MIPVSKKQKKPNRHSRVVVSADNVFDSNGNSLSYRLSQQNRINRIQSKNTTIARQHATRSDADDNGQKFIFRDVFPYRKYNLVFNTGQWLNLAGASATLGYTLEGEFYELMVITSRPEHRQVEVNLTNVPDVDTVEVRLVGAPENIRGYLEDSMSAGDLQSQINDIMQRLEALDEAVGIPYTGTDTLDDRVTALENA